MGNEWVSTRVGFGLIFCLLGFVSAQSGDTDKAKKIREAAIFTISFVACDSPSGNQLLWSIFKALRTFCAYQTFSFSCNAFRALLYIESLEVKAPSFFRSLYFLTSVAKMTSPAPSAAFAAVPYSTFNSLHLGRSTQSIVGWLIRFWDSRNINKNGEFMGITILLFDELDSVIHSFIPANRASQYRSSLKSRSIVRLDRFEVARVAHMYKLDAPVIKSNRFLVRRFDHLQFPSPDVVGEIRSVQGLISKTSQPRAETVIVYLSLWDEAASTFRGLLKSGYRSQSVLLVTLVNPKLFGGNLYLNSTQGTRFFFDTSLPEVTEFVSRQ
ncbi:hypothetical protein IGI04_019992 [Brassica rapa subsp. trilocularis]|uniref:Uncharacterized protein n=1 Tax=Brassica rapa subsp. trilocularis TaxID=1813537 RepID=A0ABQ7MHG1_BRACM|nr:hypothetical protein IGI04_019986 [Brassica rapa subsp. trilocularis]KAG5398178.1 hypothetical protein IGI04_019992 [Brassica rapa subsp. trilocularis]